MAPNKERIEHAKPEPIAMLPRYTHRQIELMAL